jgi:hypothetical protein
MSRCGRRCATGFRRTADDNRPDPAAIENAGGPIEAAASVKTATCSPIDMARPKISRAKYPTRAATDVPPRKRPGRHPKGNEAFSVARMARPGGLCRTAVDPHPLCRARTSPIPAKGSISNQRGGRLQLCGDITMAARATHSKTKRLPSPQSTSPQRKPIPTAKLARRLAEVQALRKLVQKAEASRAC